MVCHGYVCIRTYIGKFGGCGLVDCTGDHVWFVGSLGDCDEIDV